MAVMSPSARLTNAFAPLETHGVNDEDIIAMSVNIAIIAKTSNGRPNAQEIRGDRTAAPPRPPLHRAEQAHRLGREVDRPGQENDQHIHRLAELGVARRDEEHRQPTLERPAPLCR